MNTIAITCINTTNPTSGMRELRAAEAALMGAAGRREAFPVIPR